MPKEDCDCAQPETRERTDRGTGTAKADAETPIIVRAVRDHPREAFGLACKRQAIVVVSTCLPKGEHRVRRCGGGGVGEGDRASAVVIVKRKSRDDAGELSGGLTNTQVKPGVTRKLARHIVADGIKKFMYRRREVRGIVDRVLEC